MINKFPNALKFLQGMDKDAILAYLSEYPVGQRMLALLEARLGHQPIIIEQPQPELMPHA